MSSIIDYILWRGDLTFDQAPLNEVDNLIFSNLTYLNFNGLVPESFDRTTTLREAAFRNWDDRRPADMAIFQLLQTAANSRRFGNLKLCGFVDRTDLETEIQFSAITFVLPGKEIFVAFRGTDNSIVGWKEDFNMAFMAPVPAQTEAVAYLQKACRHFCKPFSKTKVIAGGHSKGGNLAMYAASFCDEKTRKNLTAVYNNDGPGFAKALLGEGVISPILKILHTFVPQDSIVGMLLDHDEPYTVVQCDGIGIAQHNPITWNIQGNQFVRSPNRSKLSVRTDTVVQSWLAGISIEERRIFVNTLFDLLEEAGIRYAEDITNNSLSKLIAIGHKLTKLDTEAREIMLKSAKELLFGDWL